MPVFSHICNFCIKTLESKIKLKPQPEDTGHKKM